MKDDTTAATRRLARLPVHGKAGRPAGPQLARAVLVKLYVDRGLSLRATAEVLGVSKEAVGRGLAAYHIKPHRRVRPSRLAAFTLVELRRRVQAEGLRATARALGVSGPTLLEYMRRRDRRRGGGNTANK